MSAKLCTRSRITDIYNILYKMYGPQNWWPADTPFEVIVGAILTQNTSWTNVEKAIKNLKQAKKLTLKRLNSLKANQLSLLIRPCGYHNIKAKRLKNFVTYVVKTYNADLNNLFSHPIKRLRAELLNINGIGPETADSILLYAAGKPVFVVDAYTMRIFQRQGLLKKDAKYDTTQKLFKENLPKAAKLFNEYHALIVKHGKDICKKKPKCFKCAIHKECEFFK